jgi:hypothetical protein
MKLREILYSPMKNYLSEAREAFERAGETDKADQLDNVVTEARRALNGVTHSRQFFHNLDSAIPLVQHQSWLKNFRALAIKIESTLDLDLDNDAELELANFTSASVTGNYSFAVFGFTPRDRREQSLVYADFSRDDFVESLDDSILNLELIALLLQKIQSPPPKADRKMLIHSSAVHFESARASLCLIAIGMLKPIHLPKVSNAQINVVNSLNQLDQTSEYQQFAEITEILSEFIASKEILSRFLSIYHVVENFMFRLPITQMQSDGFSIRRFKAMYKRLDANESESLKKFFDDCWGIASFGNKIMALSKNLSQPIVTAETALLKNLSVNWDKQGNFKTGYSKVYYALRCSIVHNKETEFHITNSSISEDEARYIEHLFITPIFELIYELVCTRNRSIFYQNSSINLY